MEKTTLKRKQLKTDSSEKEASEQGQFPTGTILNRAIQKMSNLKRKN